jgi:hypothetical protein
MPDERWRGFIRALLGSWPSQVASWGEEGIAAYVAEVQARGVGPEDAIGAIRASTSSFPPSAGELAKLARSDPSRPSFQEAYQTIYGAKGITWSHYRERALAQAHPFVRAFAESYGIDRLGMLEVNHDTYGGAVRRDLERAYEGFAERFDQRELVSVRQGRLGRINPQIGVHPESTHTKEGLY